MSTKPGQLQYADAIWFPDLPSTSGEEPGQSTAKRFPLNGASVVLCEAKISLTPGLIGQALVYRWYLQQAGAIVRETFVFAERDSYNRRPVAEALGLTVVLPE